MYISNTALAILYMLHFENDMKQLYIYTYNMGNRDLPDIYAHALWPTAPGLGHIYQANPSCPCYNLYIDSSR